MKVKDSQIEQKKENDKIRKKMNKKKKKKEEKRGGRSVGLQSQMMIMLVITLVGLQNQTD